MTTLATETTLIDISIPIHNDMLVWPGDPKVQLNRRSDVRAEDFCTISEIRLSSHTGTHVDAPRHFLSRWRPN